MNAVLEPRTGHFWGLVNFEANAKDLSFEAKVKDSKRVLEAKDVLEDFISVLCSCLKKWHAL